MNFDLSIHIDRPPADVFDFLRDKDKHLRPTDSPVLLLEKTTPGPCGAGTRFREVVRMLPFVTAEIRSQVIRHEPGRRLAEIWNGAGMSGELTYLFEADNGGTKLIQKENVTTRGLLRPLAPIIQLTLSRNLVHRLKDIKLALEKNNLNN